ncbi:molybdopterin-guanine dinucleotide biosynthesis protein B [Clostridium sp. DL1XJH146]
MKVFSVIGYTKSGKTTTIEKVIAELKKRNYSVGSVKDIHFEKFKIDTEGTNTHRHKIAGSELVTARGMYETDILYQEKLNIYDILKHYDYDYVVLEGVRDVNAPKIIAAQTKKDIDDRFDYSTFLISGKIADEIDEYRGIKALSAMDDIKKLVDYIEENTFELLPDFDEKCCNKCGYNCRSMCEMIIKGEKTRDDCKLGNEFVSLKIDGKEVGMVPFVEKLVRNSVLAVVSELDGYSENSKIEIELGFDPRKDCK